MAEHHRHQARHALRAHARSLRLRVWMMVCIAAAGVMAFTPLFHLLGFGFSFVMAIVASVAALDLGSALVRRVLGRRARTEPPIAAAEPPRAALAELARLLARASLWHVLALLGPPLLIISANALRVRNCDWWYGFMAYALMPVLSCAGATVAGALVGLAAGRRRWLGNLAPYLLFVLAVVYAVWRFYAAPPVFSFNLFSGYFPGNLYDEDLAFRDAFYWSRLYQLTGLAALVCLAAVFLESLDSGLAAPRALTRERLIAGALAVGFGLSFAALHRRSGELGFDIDARDIQRFLGARYDTEHFVIFYPPGGEIERDIHLIAADHEFRYAQVARLLGAEPERRITSYYFATAHDKRVMMGAGQVYMAKPWRDEIYVHHQSFPHPVLRHEITHVIAGAFGSPVFRVSADSWLGLPVVFNVGLIEGIAVAADWPGRPEQALTPHESVKSMIEMGMAPPAGRLLSTGFLAFSSSRSYTVAGSLVRHLLDTRGPDKLRALYRSGGDFLSVYGQSQAELLREWAAMIDAIELPPGMAETVRERFRRPSIFARPCPHAIARQRTLMYEMLARGDTAGALAAAERIVELVPGEPRHRMELASILLAASDNPPALAIYRAILGDSEHMSSTLRAEATFALASVAARSYNYDTVRALLRDADALALEEDQRRYVDALGFAAEHQGPAAGALRDYFWRYDPGAGADGNVLTGRAAAIILAEPELGMGYYLLGRNLGDRGVPRESAGFLAKSLELGLPSPALEREAARRLASAAYRAGMLDLVERAAQVMRAPEHATVTRLFGVDWLERVSWKRHGRLPALEPDDATGRAE